MDLRASFERQRFPELSQNASFKLMFWGVLASGPSYSLWKPKSLYGLNLGSFRWARPIARLVSPPILIGRRIPCGSNFFN